MTVQVETTKFYES